MCNDLCPSTFINCLYVFDVASLTTGKGRHANLFEGIAVWSFYCKVLMRLADVLWVKDEYTLVM